MKTLNMAFQSNSITPTEAQEKVNAKVALLETKKDYMKVDSTIEKDAKQLVWRK